VTPGHEVVWEYINPAHADDDGLYIAPLFEVIRVPTQYVSGWLPTD